MKSLIFLRLTLVVHVGTSIFEIPVKKYSESCGQTEISWYLHHFVTFDVFWIDLDYQNRLRHEILCILCIRSYAYIFSLYFSIFNHNRSVWIITDHDWAWSIMIGHNWPWSFMFCHDWSRSIMTDRDQSNDSHEPSWLIMITHHVFVGDISSILMSILYDREFLLFPEQSIYGSKYYCNSYHETKQMRNRHMYIVTLMRNSR